MKYLRIALVLAVAALHSGNSVAQHFDEIEVKWAPDTPVGFTLNIGDFGAFGEIGSSSHVYVTTKSQATAVTYAAGEAFASALGSRVKSAKFNPSSSREFNHDFLIEVSEEFLSETVSSQSPVMSRAPTEVTCTNFGAVVCRESDSRPVVAGYRTVESTYIGLKVVIDIYKITLGGRDEVKKETTYIQTGIARATATMVFDAGSCRNEGSAAATVARLLGERMFVGRPFNVMVDSSTAKLGCRR